MKTYYCLFVLVTACFALPLDDTEAKKKPKNTPAVVQFFYDDSCTHLANEVTMHPKDKVKMADGLYGSKSAWYASTGDMTHWYITNGFSSGTGGLQITTNPQIAQCVHYDSEVHVKCDTLKK